MSTNIFITLIVTAGMAPAIPAEPSLRQSRSFGSDVEKIIDDFATFAEGLAPWNSIPGALNTAVQETGAFVTASGEKIVTAADWVWTMHVTFYGTTDPIIRRRSFLGSDPNANAENLKKICVPMLDQIERRLIEKDEAEKSKAAGPCGTLPSDEVCTPAVPEVCTPAIPRSCVPGVPESCFDMCKPFGSCRTCIPGTPDLCTPEVPGICTPAVPKQCTPSLRSVCETGIKGSKALVDDAMAAIRGARDIVGEAKEYVAPRALAERAELLRLLPYDSPSQWIAAVLPGGVATASAAELNQAIEELKQVSTAATAMFFAKKP